MQHFSPHITRAASLAVALLGLTGTALANNTGEVFGERALALAMDDRCGATTRSMAGGVGACISRCDATS